MRSSTDLFEQTSAVRKKMAWTAMSDHRSTYFQGLWPDCGLILDVTVNEVVILQWFHQNFVLSSASREITESSYTF